MHWWEKQNKTTKINSGPNACQVTFVKNHWLYLPVCLCSGTKWPFVELPSGKWGSAPWIWMLTEIQEALKSDGLLHFVCLCCFLLSKNHFNVHMTKKNLRNDIESVCTQSTICSVVFFYSEILISLLSIPLYQLFGFQFFFILTLDLNKGFRD